MFLEHCNLQTMKMHYSQEKNKELGLVMPCIIDHIDHVALVL